MGTQLYSLIWQLASYKYCPGRWVIPILTSPTEVAQLAGAVQVVVKGPRLENVNSERTDEVGILLFCWLIYRVIMFELNRLSVVLVSRRHSGV